MRVLAASLVGSEMESAMQLTRLNMFNACHWHAVLRSCFKGRKEQKCMALDNTETRLVLLKLIPTKMWAIK